MRDLRQRLITAPKGTLPWEEVRPLLARIDGRVNEQERSEP